LQAEVLQAGTVKEIKVLLIFPKWEHADDIYRIFTRDPVSGMYHRLSQVRAS
jgi:hypothetical protein